MREPTCSSVPDHRERERSHTRPSPQRSGRECLCVVVPRARVLPKHLPPSRCGRGQHCLERGVSTGALPQSLSTLAKRLGDLLPRRASGARKRDGFFLRRLEIAAKCSRNSEDFQRVRVSACPDPLPRFPERQRGFHRRNTAPNAPRLSTFVYVPAHRLGIGPTRSVVTTPGAGQKSPGHEVRPLRARSALAAMACWPERVGCAARQT